MMNRRPLLTTSRTEIGVDAAVSQILRAVQAAIDAHSEKDAVRAGFKSVWIAMAGLDRKGLRSVMYRSLHDQIPLQAEGTLQITNDIELVAADKFHELDFEIESDVKVQSVIVLVAGTGSVAMTFKRKGTRILQTDRAGGWGALLGDNGSVRSD